MTRTRVDATVLRGLLSDAFDEAKAQYRADPPEEVEVNAELAIAMTQRPSLRFKYHRLDCSHFRAPTELRITVRRVLVEECGFIPCAFCGELNLRSWCRSLRLDHTQVWQVMTKHHSTVNRSVFLRLLAAINEEPHPSLLEAVS